MSTHRESICCKELEQTLFILEDSGPATHPVCVTQHTDFATVCLCRTVLLVSLHSHRYHHGSSDVPDDENRLLLINLFLYFIVIFPSRRFRYLAYRQMTWWGWHYLGRYRRVVLPSCIVSRIRHEFPSEEYTGHQYPPPTP